MMSGRTVYSNRVANGIGGGLGGCGLDAAAVHTETTYIKTGNSGRHIDSAQNYSHGSQWGGQAVVAFLVAWIVLAIIIFFFFYTFRPGFCRLKDSSGECRDDCDRGRAVLWAIFIALIILIIFALIMGASSGSYGSGYNRGCATRC